MVVRQRKNPSGKVVWQLDCGMVHGRRVQLSFQTRQEAEAEAARRKGVLRSHGAAGFVLSATEQVVFAEARDRLSAVGANVNEAVEFFLRHARPVRDAVTWAELVRRCLRAKEDVGCDPRYVAQMRSVAMGFGRAGHAERAVHEITRQDVEGWLRANEWAVKTWNNYLTDLRTVFAWGKAEGYLTLNPCDGVPRRKAAALDEVAFLTVGQCRALLERAARLTPGVVRRDARGQWIRYGLAEEDFRDCVAMVVIGLFCGLRPEKELGQMTWADVKVDSGVVVVTAGRAKSRRRRTVDLSENALAWLAWCRREGLVPQEPSARVCPRNLKRRWKRLRQACGIFDSWPHDGLRHTFATYHYAAHQNEARLQVLMGHRNAQVLHEHYRGLATPQEAREFWALGPPVSG